MPGLCDEGALVKGALGQQASRVSSAGKCDEDFCVCVLIDLWLPPVVRTPEQDGSV